MTRGLTTLVLWPALAVTLSAADVTGLWSVEFETDVGGNLYQAECAFKQDGQKLSGSCSGGAPGSAPLPTTGEVDGRQVTFQYKTGLGEGVTVTFSGDLNEAETMLKGKWRFVNQDGSKGTGTFSAVKR